MAVDRTSVLDDLPLFQFFSAEARRKVVPHFHEQQFQFGDLIVEEGQPGDAFYIITSGRVRVFKTGDDGREVPLAVLKAGDFFGELAILDETVRTSSVRCSSDVTVLKLDKPIFQSVLKTSPELAEYVRLRIRQRDLQVFLRENSVFRSLPLPVMAEFLNRLQPVDFPKGALIARQGEPPVAMYILELGQARAFKGKEGETRQIAFYRAGDSFGERAIVQGSDNPANIEAVTDCRAHALSPEALLQLIDEHSEFRMVIESRMEGYQSIFDARVPLDFSQELLPAEALVNKVEIDETVAQKNRKPTRGDEPFATEDGRFTQRGRRRRRISFVRQIDEMDCGAAALAMVCRHYGRRVSLSRIRQLAHTAYDGTSLKAIINAATELGLSARAVKVLPKDLGNMPLPAIVHWEGNHWVVVHEVQKRRVTIADPALGVRRIPREEFLQRWTGFAALFDYTAQFDQAPESKTTWGWAAALVRPYWGTLAQVLLLAAVASGLQLVLPVFTQIIVDKVLVENDLETLRILVIAMVAAMTFMLIATTVQRFILSFAAVHIDSAILDFVTRKMLALPMSYFNNRRTGDIINRLEGVREVREFIVYSGIGGVLAIIQISAYLTVMAVYSMTLFLVYLITVPLYLGLMYFSRKFLRPMFDKLLQGQARYRSHQIDAIRGIEHVKVAAAEQAFRDNMLNEFLTVSRTQFRSSFVAMLYESAVQAVGFLSTILFLWVGASMVMNGEITLGGFVAFNALVAMTYTPILTVLRLWDDFQLVSVRMSRLNDILEFEPEQGFDRSHLEPVPTLEGRIEFKGVHFHYGGPGSPNILDGVSLEVPPGKTVAIVGRSGSGKTTLVKCLAGLLEPTEGTILYDGVDMKTLNYRDLRRHIGAVFQENHLFSDSILNNIAFGDPDPDMEKVKWAAQIANAHGFISRLPLGYETKIGESGLALSGGQRQRIAIAAALYNNPPILIFDEATSALDTESERAIQENLARILTNRTAFVVAHRLSTIRSADIICVIENGKIAEQGTHRELMELKGLYYYLTSQQLSL